MADLSPAQRARRLIDVGVNLTLASVGADGLPWVAPVFYVPDADYDLYWTSEPTARHSVNVMASGRGAVVIVEPDPEARVDAVYMDVSVRVLEDPAEIERGIAVMAGKSQPERWTIRDLSDVSGDGPWRIFRAHPESISVRATEAAGDRAVARRVGADFPA